jgi:hypothetical protein
VLPNNFPDEELLWVESQTKFFPGSPLLRTLISNFCQKPQSFIVPNSCPIFTFELFSTKNLKESGASNNNTIVDPSLNPPNSCPGSKVSGLS